MEPSYKILLVEDDSELAKMVAEFLSSYGFEVLIEGRGDTAIGRIVSELPDAVILDVNLPGADGFSICRQVRSQFHGPIIILTARGDEMDEVIGLEVGADDFMSKPVRPRALLARLKTHLNKTTRINVAEQSRFEIDSLLVDSTSRSCHLDGQLIDLTTAEFDLLWLLAENAGNVLSRNDIYMQLNGFKYDGLDRSIDLRVSRLRKKIGDDPNNPQRIKSIRGVGYMLTVKS